MRPSASAAFILGFATTMPSPLALHAQRFTHHDPIRTVSAPVRLYTTGKFRSNYVSVGEDMFIAGQPTPAGLRELKAKGVTMIVNLRTPTEMAKVGFDEEALAKELGMTYVYLPVRGDTLFPYSPSTVPRFAEAVSNATGKVLLHCTVAWRASHLWAAYLIDTRHVDVETALANARLINLDDSDPMMLGKGPQPIEEFLGRRLPTLGHPKT
jgi:Uncharacterized protein conserved in bacteria